MTHESFRDYKNLGGINYLGRGRDQIRTDEEKRGAARACKELGLNGLVLVGATSCLTDGVILA